MTLGQASVKLSGSHQNLSAPLLDLQWMGDARDVQRSAGGRLA